jgi:MFS family permease
VWCAAYIGAFLSPIVGGSLAGHFGLQTVMLASLLFGLIAIGGFYMVPETGKGRITRPAEQAALIDEQPERVSR